jgi:uncharacterized protein YcbX
VGRVNIARIGFTPVKGGRHTRHDTAELAPAGPVGDRVFCLVDPARARVLRTVENPSLLRTSARWENGVLSTDLPDTSCEGVPVPTGEVLQVDYWGRCVPVEVVDGPWAAAYSDFLGFEVVLGRVAHPGDVVYGAGVTLVTTGSLRAASARVGREVSSARFRPTFLVDTDGAPPHVEDSWVGREVQVGEARVRVQGVVPRCAVVDLDPQTGLADAPVLRTLAGYRRGQGDIGFGVEAVVTATGRVHTGDPVEPGRG